MPDNRQQPIRPRSADLNHMFVFLINVVLCATIQRGEIGVIRLSAALFGTVRRVEERRLYARPSADRLELEGVNPSR